jgi:hypothetical protein
MERGHVTVSVGLGKSTVCGGILMFGELRFGKTSVGHEQTSLAGDTIAS